MSDYNNKVYTRCQPTDSWWAAGQLRRRTRTELSRCPADAYPDAAIVNGTTETINARAKRQSARP
ncbi:hypothetical protein ACVFVO_00540 [Advenella kashmirensis]